MVNCKKCETILSISTMQGAAKVSLLGHKAAFGHSELPEGPRSKPFELWVDDGSDLAQESDSDDIPASQPITGTVPNKIGVLYFEKDMDADGICPTKQGDDTGAGACEAEQEKVGCANRMRLSWIWDAESAAARRYEMAVSKGTVYYRDCLNPGGGDSDKVSTPADHWEKLQGPLVAPWDKLDDRTGEFLFHIELCGVVEIWRIHFSDNTIGAGRAGIIDSYFNIEIGCEGCCKKAES